ncbi:hypothetical protein [Cupriavidus sp. 2SB]|uniref:hypothetical protein n=1 Tax=Cupriavidus sp. 2SB TaxID=2502199 RepID=UPI0010F9035B|nr:hypothetical protein [Cupriavidus sp. 2SB]
MASQVDICNLALSRLGDAATVASIDPPEGSPQAGRCKQWYPICRDLVLEAHPWSFATRRVALANLPAVTPSWQFAYGKPADCLKAWAVLPSDALDDYSVGLPQSYGSFTGMPMDRVIDIGAAYTPQDFDEETAADGTALILTNQQNAVLRYTYRQNDPTRYTPSMTDAFVLLLASFLAGPIIKGDAGQAVGKDLYKLYVAALAIAKSQDSMTRQIHPKQVVPWMARR